jgi:hypothetical protein
MSFFSFTKLESRRAEQVLPGGIKKREEVEKVCGKVHIVKILCTHVCKWKNDTC